MMFFDIFDEFFVDIFDVFKFFVICDIFDVFKIRDVFFFHHEIEIEIIYKFQ